MNNLRFENAIPELTQKHSDILLIKELRIRCWLNNPNAVNTINKEFLDSLNDDYDNSAQHFVIRDGKSIIAATRLVLFNSINEIEFPGIFKKIDINGQIQFYYLSRIVVDPNYRRLGLARKLELTCLSFLKEEMFKWAFLYCFENSITHLESYGFKNFGPIDKRDDRNFVFDKMFMMILLPEDLKL